MKVLAFTVSYQRPYFLRHCVTQMAAQSHGDVLHSVSITDDGLAVSAAARDEHQRYLFSDVDCRKTRFSYHPNRDQHANYLCAITSVDDYRDYDLYVKIDDDDVYKCNYIRRCVEFHKTSGCDISSTPVLAQINGHRLRRCACRDLGRNPRGSNFCMPQTFAFNAAALDAIRDLDPDEFAGWEDEAWRLAWVKRGLVHRVRPDDSEFVWHVHGRNISVGSFLQGPVGPLLHKTIFRAFDCVHLSWIGTIFLYDDGTLSVSTNGDIGHWTFVERRILELRWERWPRELLAFNPARGQYECADKDFVAADVTRGRQGTCRRLPPLVPGQS